MQQSMQSIYEKQTITIPDFYKSFKMNIAWILEFFDASRNSSAQINIKSKFPFYITKTLISTKTVQRYKTQSCHFKKNSDRIYHINWQPETSR